MVSGLASSGKLHPVDAFGFDLFEKFGMFEECWIFVGGFGGSFSYISQINRAQCSFSGIYASSSSIKSS